MKHLQKEHGFQLEIELQWRTVPLTCVGEGGLTLGRIQAKPRKYFKLFKQANPSILILDLGT